MDQNNSDNGLQLIIVHPCEILRLALGALFQQCGYTVCRSFGTCENLFDQLDSAKGNLILVHYSQCLSSGFIGKITSTTGASVALLASSDSFHKDSYQDIMERIAEGVTGFLDMDEPIHVFLSELEDIASGDIVISKHFARNLAKKACVSEGDVEEVLSEREMQILDLVASGSTNREIGQELFISEHTVKSYLSQILSKLDLKNRQQAVAYIMKKRLTSEKTVG